MQEIKRGPPPFQNQYSVIARDNGEREREEMGGDLLFLDIRMGLAVPLESSLENHRLIVRLFDVWFPYAARKNRRSPSR